MEQNILELIDMTKTFPGVRALNKVNLSVKQGEIHAVVGENGAGKSTLMKIISGVFPYGSYSGTMRFQGEEKRFSGIKESEKNGIAIIYQELALVKGMSIAENVFLGNEILKKNKTIDWNRTISETIHYLAEVGLDLNPMTPVINLGIGQQQLVEIAKAIAKNAKLLILDEPTAPLTDTETDNLLNIMRELKKKGVTCLFITHKLEEVFRVADSVTILRDGETVSHDAVADLTQNTMIARMVGRDITDRFPTVSHKPGQPILSVTDWTVKDPELPTRDLVHGVSFDVRHGEILGIAGLMGSGRTELAMSIFGCYTGWTTGVIRLENKELKIRRPQDAIRHGISYLSEDRKRYGLNMLMDIEDNITLSSLEKISKAGIIDASQKTLCANRYIQELNIRTPSSRQFVVNLSGGNQQKVVLGKWLMTQPTVLILDEPTRGVDVGSKYEIYEIMNQLILDGVSIIMISSELPEIIGMSDRVLVMHEGTVAGVLSGAEITQQQIMTLATGGVKQ